MWKIAVTALAPFCVENIGTPFVSGVKLTPIGLHAIDQKCNFEKKERKKTTTKKQEFLSAATQIV